MGGAAGLRPSAPTISGGSGLRFIPPSLYSPSKALHLSNIIDACLVAILMSEIFKYNFYLICESSNIQRLVRGPGCIDHFHLGSSRTNFSKSNISPAPSPGAPPAFSEDVWTVQSSSSLRCSLLSSHPNPVRIFRRGNRIF